MGTFATINIRKMAKTLSLVHCFRLLGMLPVCMDSALCEAVEAVAETTFVHHLDRGNYFNASDPVRYFSSALNWPDPPSWLHQVQRTQKEDGLLYGSPHSSKDSVEMEVVAINTNTFDAVYKTFTIEVMPNPESVSSLAELKILNMNVAEFLTSTQMHLLLDAVHNIWPTSDGFHLVSVEPSAQIYDPTEEIQEGVFVKLGSSDSVLEEEVEMSNSSNCQRISDLIPDFNIDSCHMTHPVNVGSVERPDMVHSGLENENSWEAQHEDIHSPDHKTAFIVTVVLPLGLGLILFLILSYTMFGRREGVMKRNKKTPESQLIQFDSIRRATTNLRYMSERRDGPAPNALPSAYSSCSPQHSEHNRSETTSTAGTLPYPTPSYRLPPAYNTNSTNSTSCEQQSHASDRPSSLLASQYDEEQSAGEEQKLVKSSYHTLPLHTQ